VNVRAAAKVRAPPSVIVPPVALYVIGALIVTALVVMVGLPVNVISPVADQVQPLVSVNELPLTVGVPVPEKVPVKEEHVIDWHGIVPESVTVTPVKNAKNAPSDVVGADAPAVAATIVCEVKVPPTLTVQVLPLPPVTVPRLVPPAERRTVMPTTRAGDPVVVSVVPLHDALKNAGSAAAQTVVVRLSHVAVPPIQ